MKNMQDKKIHTLYIRGVKKETKNKIKKSAITNNRSVNSEILNILNNHVAFLKSDTQSN
jgi:plasmid stability protein